MSISNPTLGTLGTLSIITYFQIHPIMQNKPNFHNVKIIVNFFVTSIYEKLRHLVNGKNKAKTNPIKANSKPIKPKTNPIQTQLERSANPEPVEGSKPIWRKGKNERFCADKEPYNDINNATRGFYHPIKVPAPKFEHLKYLKLQPIMLLSLRVPIKMNQKLYLEEKP